MVTRLIRSRQRRNTGSVLKIRRSLRSYLTLSVPIAAVIIALFVQVLFINAKDTNAVAQIPQNPQVIFEEAFENVVDPAVPTLLDQYTGPAPLAMTYTADPSWINGPTCNGLLASFNSTPGTSGCNAVVYDTLVRPVAQTLGNTYGGGNDNHVLSQETFGSGSPTPAATFQTNQLISLPSTNRFIAFSINVGVTSCNFSHPLLRFFLIDGVEVPVNTSPIDPCTDPRGNTIGVFRVGNYATDTAILFNGSSVGVKLTNDQSDPNGNDYAVDNIRLLDTTPQLDKSFLQDDYTVGESIPLTFTVTNTSELASKNGWTFTDNLPSGLKVAQNQNTQTTCSGASIVAAPGSGTIQAIGNLNAGQVYCEVTLSVVATTAGTFTNGASNVSVHGLDLPNTPASITVSPSATLADTGDNQLLIAGIAIAFMGVSIVVSLRQRILNARKA